MQPAILCDVTCRDFGRQETKMSRSLPDDSEENGTKMIVVSTKVTLLSNHRKANGYAHPYRREAAEKNDFFCKKG